MQVEICLYFRRLERKHPFLRPVALCLLPATLRADGTAEIKWSDLLERLHTIPACDRGWLQEHPVPSRLNSHESGVILEQGEYSIMPPETRKVRLLQENRYEAIGRLVEERVELDAGAFDEFTGTLIIKGPTINAALAQLSPPAPPIFFTNDDPMWFWGTYEFV